MISNPTPSIGRQAICFDIKIARHMPKFTSRAQIVTDHASEDNWQSKNFSKKYINWAVRRKFFKKKRNERINSKYAWQGWKGYWAYAMNEMLADAHH